MNNYICKSPVLFLVFNRPDVTARVFGAIRKAKPPRLYVAADGARPEREGEAEKCREVREIATAVDWDCEVKTLFRDKNLGCGKAVSEGITWFFENEPEGIILEDDCLPDLTFFEYCDCLLKYYRNSALVYQICGYNPLRRWERGGYSHHFSSLGSIWGWASWKRAWDSYDFSLKDWHNVRAEGYVNDLFPLFREHAFVTRNLDAIDSRNLDTWDYQWAFAKFRNRALCVLPSVNLIQNIGFDERATHTKGFRKEDSVESISVIRCPIEFIEDNRLTKALSEKYKKKSFLFRLKDKLTRLS